MNNQEQGAFYYIAEVGKKLMEMHINYDASPEYPLIWQWNPNVERSFHVTRMHFSKDKSEIVVNESLTLAGIPASAHEYILGNKSALEWIVDQYRIKRDERSEIISDPNNADDPEYIVHHICRVCYVSVETVRLQQELAARVNFDKFSFVGVCDEELKDYWKKEH